MDNDWTRSSYCDSSQCVEVAGAEFGEILVRDSKDREGPVLRFTPDEWVAFIDGVKNGEFNLD